MDTFILISAIFIFVLGIWNWYELYHFQITEYTVYTEKDIGQEKTFLFLSDLHDFCYGKENKRLIRAIEGEHWDLILIGGDMINRKRGKKREQTVQTICRLAQNHKIYYANGNHEYKMKIHPDRYQNQYDEYKSVLEKSGVLFLENESAIWENIRIYGLELPIPYFEKFRKKRVNIEEIWEKIGKNDASRYTILLAHNPRYMRDYQKWEPDLVLSGHFHGGIIRLPLMGAVLSPQFDWFPGFSGGIYPLGRGYGIVSRGIGTHSVRWRLFNRPEIIKIKLQNQN